MYSGKTVVVTGGAGHIGRAITEAYLRHGANVVICGRKAPSSLPKAAGNTAMFVQADIRNPDESQKVIDVALETFGRLDILVNNAGGSPPVKAEDASPRLTERIIGLNLVAPLIMSQQAFPAMRQHQDSVANIVNIASVSGTRPSPGTTAYGAAKSGLISATKSLAMEWGPDVRINAVVVGLVKHEAGIEHYGGEQGFERISKMLPLGRMAEPADIANACIFLTSEQARYISGATLEVDGGGEVPVFLHLANELSGGN